MCRPKHVEQLRNIGIINSTTRLHLVSSFYEFHNVHTFISPGFHNNCLIITIIIIIIIIIITTFQHMQENRATIGQKNSGTNMYENQ